MIGHFFVRCLVDEKLPDEQITRNLMIYMFLQLATTNISTGITWMLVTPFSSLNETYIDIKVLFTLIFKFDILPFVKNL